MSEKQIYEIEFNFTNMNKFSKYSLNKDNIISAYKEIKSKFKEHQVDYTRTEKFVYFSLCVETVPSSVLSTSGPLCYPASIEKELLSFVGEVSQKYNLHG